MILEIRYRAEISTLYHSSIGGIQDLISKETAGPINLGDPNEISILTVAEEIIEMTNSKSEIILKPLPLDDPIRRKPDISLAKETLKWSPNISRQSGLEKTIEYFSKEINIKENQLNRKNNE